MYLRYIFSQILLMVSVSKYLKDTEDTAFYLSVSVSWIHFKSIFPHPDRPIIYRVRWTRTAHSTDRNRRARKRHRVTRYPNSRPRPACMLKITRLGLCFEVPAQKFGLATLQHACDKFAFVIYPNQMEDKKNLNVEAMCFTS